jgi:hypothetical protein
MELFIAGRTVGFGGFATAIVMAFGDASPHRPKTGMRPKRDLETGFKLETTTSSIS